jgi:dihydroorotate dehydrogenase electron transfer subunit
MTSGLSTTETTALVADMTIVSHRILGQQSGQSIWEMVLVNEQIVKRIVSPGQFLSIKVPQADLVLRRPISVAAVDYENGQCTLIYRVQGEGTRMLAELEAGDKVDVLGPLGTGFPIQQPETNGLVAVLIGGGIGVPPLFELSKQLQSSGYQVQAFLGFATRSAVFYEDEFSRFAKVQIATDDGSYGFGGNVLQLFDNAFPTQVPDAIYACGAMGMLRAVDAKFRNHSNAYISLEARMACSVGACYACVVHVQGDETEQLSRKVCDQGPVFKTGEVVF